MPLYEYTCENCDRVQPEIRSYDNRDEPGKCEKCGNPNCPRLPSSPGGYKIRGNNSASVTPKSSGSFRRKK